MSAVHRLHHSAPSDQGLLPKVVPQNFTANVFASLKVRLANDVFDASNHLIGEFLELSAVRRRQPEAIYRDFAHKRRRYELGNVERCVDAEHCNFPAGSSHPQLPVLKTR
ncbi:hypothetical protein PQR33_05770 [Paraburkholderia sediminicola]|uniref:hypothetical protein n=1 Tax=Paraburkholderia sediminicola TaxID=458836 RepID=UPI0038BBA411